MGSPSLLVIASVVNGQWIAQKVGEGTRKSLCTGANDTRAWAPRWMMEFQASGSDDTIAGEDRMTWDTHELSAPCASSHVWLGRFKLLLLLLRMALRCPNSMETMPLWDTRLSLMSARRTSLWQRSIGVALGCRSGMSLWDVSRKHRLLWASPCPGPPLIK